MKRYEKIIADIMQWFYTEPDFIKLIRKNVPPHLVDDAMQEIGLIIWEYDEDELIRLHDENRLKYFLIRVILNQVASSTSPFYYKYRKNSKNVELSEVEYSLEADNEIDMNFEDIEKEEDKLIDKVKKYLSSKKRESVVGWHDSEIYKMHKFEDKAFRQIQKEFNIHYTYAFRAKERIQREIEEKFGKEYKDIKNKKQ